MGSPRSTDERVARLPLGGRALLVLALVSVAQTGDAQDAPAQLTILAPESLQPLAREVGRTLNRRSGLEVHVGEAPPILPEAVAPDELSMVPGAHGGLLLAMGRPGGGTADTVLVLEGRSEDAFPVALAVEALRDEASRPLPPLPDPPSSAYVFLEYEEVPVERQMRATPTLYMKILAGYSPVRNQWLVGPGAGLGLCISGHCLVIEADLPLVPEEIQWQDGRTLRYRAVSTSLRLQIRPVIREAWSFGLTLGALSRMGNVTWVEADIRRRATNFGARASAEIAVRIAGPFEAVVEAGIDVLKDRAVFRHGTEHTFVEDRYTPWTTVSLRMRPFQR